jgi:hypothetical protein
MAAYENANRNISVPPDGSFHLLVVTPEHWDMSLAILQEPSPIPHARGSLFHEAEDHRATMLL